MSDTDPPTDPINLDAIADALAADDPAPDQPARPLGPGAAPLARLRAADPDLARTMLNRLAASPDSYTPDDVVADLHNAADPERSHP